MAKLVSLEEAVSRVESGMTLGIGGMTNYRRPVGFVTELIRQAEADDLTLLGLTLGIESDLLIAAEMVSAVRTCYFGFEYLPAPVFTKAAGEGAIEIIEESEASIALGLRAALAKMPSLPAKGWFGTDLLELRPDIKTTKDPYTGEGFVSFPAIRPDVAVIHVEKADANGNAVISGNRAIDRELAALADYTIITAEEIVSTEEIMKEGAYLTADIVDAVVELPMGAYPTSCYPNYTFDVSFLRSFIEHAFQDHMMIFLDDYIYDVDSHVEFLEAAEAESLSSLDPRKLLGIKGDKKKFKPSRADIMVKAIADCVVDGEVLAQGIATPLVSAGYYLAKATHAENVRFANSVGNCLTEEPIPITIQGYEFGLLDNAIARMSFTEASCEYLPSFAPKEFLRPAQVDTKGNTNNLWTTHEKSGERMRWPGAGGIPEVSSHNERLHLYIPRQRAYNVVEETDMVSGVGHGEFGPGPVKLITDLAVYTFENGELELESIHPGVKPKDVQKHTGFEIDIPDDIPLTPVPSQEEFELLYNVIDPLGVRELELMGSMKRLLKTIQIVSKERGYMRK